MSKIIRGVGSLLLIGMFLLTTSKCFSEEKVFNLATLEWLPFVGEGLPDNGVSSDIAQTALERLGYKVNIHFMPWIRCLEDTSKGIYDGCYPAYYSDEREKIYSVSNSIMSSRLGFYKRKKNNIAHKTLDDLTPYAIGVVRGYVNGLEFDAADFLNKVEGRSDKINMKKLLWNRIDLVVIDDLVGMDILNRLFPERVSEVEFLDPPLEIKTLHLLISKATDSDGMLRDSFDKEIDKMKEEGVIDKIILKHGFKVGTGY